LATHQDLINKTQYWLQHIIIDLNFCPFAQREFKNKTIRYAVDDSCHLESSLTFLANELAGLDQLTVQGKNTPTIETTLIIFRAAFNDFDDFLDFIDLADQLVDDLGYRGIYQLAHFHPDYCFDGVDTDDASNYTNRSPYPTLHLLRESSIQRAIETHPDTSKIPDTNIALARELGVIKIKNIMKKA